LIWRILIIAAVALILVVLAIACLRVRIHVEFTQDNSDTDGFVLVSTLFGLVKVRKRIVSVEVTMTSDGPALQTKHTAMVQNHAETSLLTTREVMHIIKHWQQWLALFGDVWQQFRHVLRKFAIHEFRIRGNMGTGDVILTGMAYGMLWAAVSGAVGWLTYLARWNTTPDICIDANFKHAEFRVSVQCIATVRAGYLMLTAVRVLRAWRRRISDGSPNPGTHEDSHGEYSRNGRRQHDYRRSG
jgi:Protein of unknown function (DUF2953)